MGRPAKQPTPVSDTAVETPDPLATQLLESQNTLARIEQAASEERDLLNQLLGQAQMADAFGKFSQTVWGSKLAYVKENKLYRLLKGKKTPNGLELTGSWEEFCELLGVSDEKANQDIANLRAFGEEALESMSRMGIGYRELRQFRKLPDDQKTALIEVAKTGDKESFVELAEEIIAKHTKEKEELSKRADEAEANLEARADVLKGKDSKINQLTEQLEKTKKRVKAMQPADVGEEIRKEAAQAASLAEVQIRAMRPSLQALTEHTDAHDISHAEFMAGLISQLSVTLCILQDEFNIKNAPDGNNTPEWLRPEAEQAIKDSLAAAMAETGASFDADGRFVPAGGDK